MNKYSNFLKALPLAALIVVLFFSGCVGGDSTEETTTVTLYGFSVLSEVMTNEIIPDFQAYWKEQTGQDVNFETSFAGSGTVTNQIIAGTPAEVAYLSHELDAIRLREAGKTTTDWSTFQYKGIVSETPYVMLVRTGNPKGITDWADLANEGVEIISPDPATSGGAMWGIYAVYGSGLKKTGDAAQARELLKSIAKNIVSMPSSARKAMTTFDAGVGDVLITYEEESLLKIAGGGEYEIVVPESSIIVESPVVIVDDNVASEERELVQAFVDFLFTETAQSALADYGFNAHFDSINAQHPEFATIQTPFYVSYLGGWETAKTEIIDGIWTEIQEEI